MMMLRLLAATATAAVAVSLALVVFPPPVRLAGRLRPHLEPALARLGIALAVGGSAAASRLPLRTGGGRTPLDTRLRRSGLWPELTSSGRLSAYRVRILARSGLLGAAATALGVGTGAATAPILVMAAAGTAAGVSSARASVERAARARCDVMRLELATVCQLLALWIRTGGGIVASCAQLVARGEGEVVGEIAEALRLHRAGIAAEDAFGRIAAATPERFAARCYRLLGGAQRRGADVGSALLALADELRTDMRESRRREATRRRAAMLLPIVGILGPTLVLFVAAPLPWIVLRAL